MAGAAYMGAASDVEAGQESDYSFDNPKVQKFAAEELYGLGGAAVGLGLGGGLGAVALGAGGAMIPEMVEQQSKLFAPEPERRMDMVSRIYPDKRGTPEVLKRAMKGPVWDREAREARFKQLINN